MTKVLIELQVVSLDAALRFYCEELALFEFRQDYGMRTVSLAHIANPSIQLLLSEGAPAMVERPVFRIEVQSCETIFQRLKSHRFESGATLLSQEIFDYPLEKSLALQDPSGNLFVLFEEH